MYVKETQENLNNFARSIKSMGKSKKRKQKQILVTAITSEKSKLDWLERGMSIEAEDWKKELLDRIRDLELKYTIIKKLGG